MCRLPSVCSLDAVCCAHRGRVLHNVLCFNVQVVVIRVHIPTLERILVDAFDSIGYRIYDKTKAVGYVDPEKEDANAYNRLD